MKLLRARYLADGKLFNHGQEATLIQIESEQDFETLWKNIVDTRYYDRAYYESHSGLKDDQKVPHFWAVAEMVRSLGPRSVVDVGCGRADVISLLAHRGISVCGVDYSEDIRKAVWPNVRDALVTGELGEACARLASAGRRFDTLCAFDIWEHLRPSQLGPSIEALSALATDDALTLFVIPAFGEDRVFGEQFPLEVEENRHRFDSREPFEFLFAERADPPIPASGHLIWAHTDWWERQFTSRGWIRQPQIERKLHAIYDLLVPYSVRAFYVFCRDPERVKARTRALLSTPAPIARARLLPRLARSVALGHLGKPEGKALLRPVLATAAGPEVRRVYRRIRGREDG